MKKTQRFLILFSIMLLFIACGQETQNTNTEDVKLIEVKSHLYAAWDLYTADENEFVEYQFSKNEEFISAVESGLEGLFTECTIDDEWMTLGVTETQKKEILTIIDRKIDIALNTIPLDNSFFQEVQYSKEEGSLNIYIDGENWDVDSINEFMNAFSNSRIIWLCQLEQSLLSESTEGVLVSFVNQETEYVIDQQLFDTTESEDELSLNQYLVRRSYYEDYSETTVVKVRFNGFVEDVFEAYGEIQTIEYAQFKANDNTFLEKEQIYYISSDVVKNILELENRQELNIELSTDMDFSTLRSDTLPIGTLIDDESVLNITIE